MATSPVGRISVDLTLQDSLAGFREAFKNLSAVSVTAAEAFRGMSAALSALYVAQQDYNAAVAETEEAIHEPEPRRAIALNGKLTG